LTDKLNGKQSGDNAQQEDKEQQEDNAQQGDGDNEQTGGQTDQSGGKVSGQTMTKEEVFKKLQEAGHNVGTENRPSEGAADIGDAKINW